MGARLIHFRAKTPAEVAGNKIQAPMFDEGEFLSFDPDRPIEEHGPARPLLYMFKPGQQVTVLKTNMSRAPAFKHKSRTTDFLVVRFGRRKATIREIPAIYTIGTVEALEEVNL